MPLNNDLEPIELPMDLKFDENPTTVFTNNLRALTTELVDAPTSEQARNVAWHYVKATWADTPYEIDPATANDAVKSKNLLDVLQFRALPTPMECLGFTFRLSGLSFQEVTHIIRHRAGSFAAQCTGELIHSTRCADKCVVWDLFSRVAVQAVNPGNLTILVI